MTYQSTFQRHEVKYLLNKQDKLAILRAMAPYMKLDAYGRTTIRSIYFDTDTFRLIRRSLEKPVYKEKLRLRSYQQAAPDDPIFIELKKKYRSVVYKRRLSLPEKEAMACFQKGKSLPVNSQIAEEVDYFRNYYGLLRPKVFLSYEREAYFSPDYEDLRITFDENILFRPEDLTLQSSIYGIPLLEKGQTLMEVKTAGGIPLWLSHVLTQQKIFKTSFSKYGLAYCKISDGNMLHQEYRRYQYA